MIIHRVFSWILIILIIAPLHTVISILRLFFNIINAFHYDNFWNEVIVPEKAHEKYGYNIIGDIFGKIAMIFIFSWDKFVEEMKELNTCKF
jgi:hypothetical protein